MDKKQALENYGVSFTPINICEMMITFPNSNYIINKDNRIISSIEFNDSILQLGDMYNCSVNNFDIQYKTNHIIESKKDLKTFYVLESIYNKTSLFIIPLIFKNKTLASYIEYNSGNIGYLMNGYLDCNFIEHKAENSIFILLKFSKSSRFKAQEEYLIKHECFVRTIDINNRYVLYEFIIPDNFIEDYKLLLDGKYSLISKQAKERIITFHYNSQEGGLIKKILIREESLIKHYEKELDVNMNYPDRIELYSKFDENDILIQDIL